MQLCNFAVSFLFDGDLTVLKQRPVKPANQYGYSPAMIGKSFLQIFNKCQFVA